MFRSMVIIQIFEMTEETPYGIEEQPLLHYLLQHWNREIQPSLRQNFCLSDVILVLKSANLQASKSDLVSIANFIPNELSSKIA